MTETLPPSTLRSPSLPGSEVVEQAASRLEGVAHQTPVQQSTTLDRITGSEVYLKCENFQRTGAFKFRGAYNALARYKSGETRPEGSRGVLTYSSGNHAQAIALSSSLLDIPATIVMPEDAPRAKLAATRDYGAEVILYDRLAQSREPLAAEIAQQRSLTVIPPYDHVDVLAGQGTAAGELDVLLVCLGGGGLLSGCALAAALHSPACQVVGVEPEAGDDGARSFRTGELQSVENPDTIADGARTPYLGQLTFPLIQRHVSDIVTVSDRALIEAMQFLWQRMKLVVEPTGALAMAALLQGCVETRGKRVGVVISGGNVDLVYAGALFARIEE
jgi:threonine dehydratase